MKTFYTYDDLTKEVRSDLEAQEAAVAELRHAISAFFGLRVGHAYVLRPTETATLEAALRICDSILGRAYSPVMDALRVRRLELIECDGKPLMHSEDL